VKTETLPRVHDPVIAKENGVYTLFSTGNGITIYTSPNRVDWQRAGRVFEKPLAWAATTIAGSTHHYWAPDISFWNGKWHLYYSVSTFGSNRSAIGLATNPTLDNTHSNYAWTDEGIVIESNHSDDFNAIDPAFILDENGQPWLSFGSFWGGLKLIQLDLRTVKIKKDAPLLSIARRSDAESNAIEAPYIWRRGDFYYLFASFDFCCKGVASTYNIRVGRADSIEGPYLDREGRAMLDGGGTLIRSSEERWIGPGHNAVFEDDGRDFLIYHAYDAQNNGRPALRIEPLNYDEEGWPHV